MLLWASICRNLMSTKCFIPFFLCKYLHFPSCYSMSFPSVCQCPLRPNRVQRERNRWLHYFLSVTTYSPLSKSAPATVSQSMDIIPFDLLCPPHTHTVYTYTQKHIYICTHTHKYTHKQTNKQTSLWTRTVLFHKCRKCVTIIKLFSRDVHTWNRHCCK